MESGANQGTPSAAQGNGTAATAADVKKPRGVCVALQHDGKPIRVHGDTPLEFLPALQSSTLAWINFALPDPEKDGTEVAARLGFSDTMVATLLQGRYSNYEDRDVELGLLVPAVRIRGMEVKTFNLIVLLRKGLILTIHNEEITRFIQFSRYADVFLRKLPDNMPAEDKLTNMLVRVLDENNNRNFEQLRTIEEQADWLSEELSDPKTPREALGRKIYEMKHSLITYLSNLWATLDVLNSLRYGDAHSITDNPKVLSKVTLLIEDVNRQISLAEHTSEVLASGLEVLQSLYNNQLQTLNNRMTLAVAWLTILGTALLVPNTIATFFGSIAGLDDRTLMWYTFITVVATVNATVLAWWWVQKKVIIPHGAADTAVLAHDEAGLRRSTEKQDHK
ncbi:MAG TPA: CorA family divalent cation transporter [Methanomassiliicoccales archaeon]|nr:CorA family divalent cation transporter [Methanomassiliicoccales archaeon]